MVCIKKSDVPAYLHESELYRSLSDDDNEDLFEVSAGHFKLDTRLESAQDLHHILSTLRFWGVSIILDSIEKFLCSDYSVDLVHLLSEYGQDFPYLSTLIALKKATRIEDKFAVAICHGDITVIEYLRGKESRESELCTFAALSRNATGKYCALAAEHGRLQCLKYLWLHKFSWKITATICAAERGHMDVLRFLHEEKCPWNLDVSCAAARNGHLSCLTFLHQQGCPWDKWTCYYAAQNNHLPCLQYAHEQGCPWTSSTCIIAAKKGNMECLKFAHEHGCPWEKSIAYTCAERGSLECLQYVHEHGCPWNASTCAFAASTNQLACLRYAHEQGCPWDENTCSVAASGGYLDCLKYAHRHGCPWDGRTTYTAAAYGKYDCLKYAVERGCPCEEEAMGVYYEHCAGSQARIAAQRAHSVLGSVAALFCRY